MLTFRIQNWMLLWKKSGKSGKKLSHKTQIEVDKASRKACKKLGATSKRKMEEAGEVKPRKSRR